MNIKRVRDNVWLWNDYIVERIFCPITVDVCYKVYDLDQKVLYQTTSLASVRDFIDGKIYKGKSRLPEFL